MSRSFYVPVEGKEYVIGIEHPIDGAMRAYGAFWTDDHFTFSLVRAGVLRKTDEVDPNPPPQPGPQAIMQQRRVSAPRKRMRTHIVPLDKMK